MAKKSSQNDFHVSFRPLNHEQKHVFQELKTCSVAFLTGPAGTAKTFVATASGLVRQSRVGTKLKISRPAIQQGTEIGYLPGTASEKTSPFLVPIYDAVETLCGERNAEDVRRGIEIVPLSLIRGRTVKDATHIIDEAQNLTRSEILTICTRLGENGQIIFCGDITQNDHRNHVSPLEDAASLLHGTEVAHPNGDLERIEWFRFTEDAIVRHPLIPLIIKKFEKRNFL